MTTTDWILVIVSFVGGAVAGFATTSSFAVAALSAFAALGALGVIIGIGAYIDEQLRKHYRRI